MEKNIEEFNRDVRERRGYVYTSDKRRSFLVANRRITDEVLAFAGIVGKRVIDVGCGDGTYTQMLADAGAAYVLGADAARDAIECAKEKIGDRGNLCFRVQSAYDLEGIGERFDLAVIRGLLHHLDDAPRAIRQSVAVAREAVVVEPNGYSPALKVIEKLSRYHREHGEKSYTPSSLDRWFAEAGARVVRRSYIGLIPMFCPDALIGPLKSWESLVERLPIVRHLLCAQYVLHVRTDDNPRFGE